MVVLKKYFENCFWKFRNEKRRFDFLEKGTNSNYKSRKRGTLCQKHCF